MKEMMKVNKYIHNLVDMDKYSNSATFNYMLLFSIFIFDPFIYFYFPLPYKKEGLSSMWLILHLLKKKLCQFQTAVLSFVSAKPTCKPEKQALTNKHTCNKYLYLPATLIGTPVHLITYVAA